MAIKKLSEEMDKIKKKSLTFITNEFGKVVKQATKEPHGTHGGNTTAERNNTLKRQKD